VDGLYASLKAMMIKVLTKDSPLTEKEYNNSELTDLMQKLEHLVISKVTEINFRDKDPKNQIPEKELA
jgi:hypothetical protein